MNVPTKVNAPSMLMDPQGFEQMYRVGKMLASSVLFPEHLRKGSPEQAAANGALVMNMAMRLNEDPLTVAQNIYFVGGKPGWSTSYLIAKANQGGVFENPIDWEIKGEGDSLSVKAWAKVAATGKQVHFTCDMAMAKAENWTKNAKYKSMPELMLRYRSAAALIRLYVPDVMIGVPAQIEVELGGDMRDVTPQDFKHADPKSEAKEAAVEAEVVADEKDSELTESAKTEAPDPEQFKALYEMILRDLADAPTVDDALELYGAQIEQMKVAAPDMHKELEAEIKSYRDGEKPQ